MSVCGDNRFELIARARAKLVDGTNITTSPEEMAVLDSFLYRCWQMGWLDRPTTHAVVVSDESTDCATGYCRCELCGKPIDMWDRYCRHCGARLEYE